MTTTGMIICCLFVLVISISFIGGNMAKLFILCSGEEVGNRRLGQDVMIPDSYLQKQHNITALNDNRKAIENKEIIILAVGQTLVM
jgi:hypothetical protein